MRLPPLNSLRAFEAAARHKSFSRAGDELFLSHSAISHQIKRLEQWLGNRLFNRRSKGVELTENGERLSYFLSPSFRAMADLCGMIRSDTTGKSITVGCIPSIASRWLIPQLDKFSAAYPDIEVNVQYASAKQIFTTTDFDALISLGRDQSPNKQSTKIFGRGAKPVCSPYYLSRQGPIATAADIAKVHLLHDEGRAGWTDWFRLAGVAVDKPPTGPIFQDFNLLATAVIAGHGVALCPVEVFSVEIQRGDLIVLSDIEIFHEEGYFISIDQGGTETAKLFRAWSIEVTSSNLAVVSPDSRPINGELLTPVQNVEG